jgi:2-phospho-L-lactate guanylyltransferase (CobY/MobA/RfbA family)
VVTIVIPFAGTDGKTRLNLAAEQRGALALAMLADVLAACGEVGSTLVATEPGGQGAAVAAALASVEGPVVVVNADLPCVTPADVVQLAAAAPALVAAADGTTNALSLPSAADFAPLYGAGSAERFRAQTCATSLEIPNLADDVDTLDDLERLGERLGPYTRAALAQLQGSVV